MLHGFGMGQEKDQVNFSGTAEGLLESQLQEGAEHLLALETEEDVALDMDGDEDIEVGAEDESEGEYWADDE
ncbi:hypothetical protein HYDPIDRAFT_39616 [Hydnomerulius pinastri MD-312]|nr:hypothetical protein HYDPIDRAFT_39616 [Hydnomerulius pinastri MD-312]